MESGEATKTLPDDLLEMIMVRMPYPHIYKAGALSKSWRDRFEPIANLPGKLEKHLATSFQRRVREQSINWGPFFPLALGKELSSGYSWASQNWLPLPSIQCLMEGELQIRPNLTSMNGPLNIRLCWPNMRKLCVANIFTHKWKLFPVSPNFLKNGTFGSIVLVSDASMESYKVILLYEDRQRLDDVEQWSADIYDSKSDAWSTLVEDISILCSPAYLNGLLYMVASFDLRDLLRINLEEGTSEALKLKFHEAVAIENADLVVCDGKLLMIVDDLDSPETLRVLQIDLESLQLLELARGPPPGLMPGRLSTRHPISHDGFIFFGMQKPDNPKLVYNVRKNEWTCFDLVYPLPRNELYGAISFQPGLNPFMDP